jgi:SAM-dependent methyltransferase
LADSTSLGAGRQAHWEAVHQQKSPDAVSWYRPHLDTSLQLIEDIAPNRTASIIDVGGGQSTLVDDLLERGYERLTVLEIAPAAIAANQRRLGHRAARVQWLVGDVTEVDVEPATCDVWHDRAVFHFLASEAERRAYVTRVSRGLKPGGHLIVAAFGLQAPAKCSGLDVVRYDAPGLQKALGPAFQLVKTVHEEHRTPTGSFQPFLYGLFRIQE